MCGIVGAIAKRDILDILLAGLHSLEYRGYDSAGLAVINEGKLHTIKTPGKVFELEKAIQDEHFNDQGNIGIAHTRWATHGEPTKENAHPQISGTIAVVHNGIIENYRPLKEKLQALGYEFKSTTDTEVLAHLIANYRKQTNSLEEAVRLALKDVTGSYAIAVIDANEPDVIVGAKNHSPLVIGIGIGENFLASDVLALLPVTSRFIYLDDGELCVVKRKNVEVFNQEGHRLVKHSTICTEGVETISKGKYRHFMEKEIFEQPQALFNTCLGRLNASGVENEAFHGLKLENLKNIEHIQIVACGTSYHAGLVGKYYLEELAKIHTSVEIASEYRYRHAVVPKNSLFITISQSGETADTRAALALAKKIGFKTTLAICNVSNSSIVRESDLVLLTRAGSEIGVASTKAFTTQLLALLLLTIFLGRNNGQIDEALGKELINSIRTLPELAQKALNINPQIQEIAQDFAGKEHTLFLGRGMMYPIALEGALKLKEISYTHSEAYAAGELKHGTISLIEEGTPVVAIVTDDNVASKTISNIKEVKSRGANVIYITNRNDEEDQTFYDSKITVPKVNDLFSPLLTVIPLQMIAYELAKLKGCNIDKPKNLAKSVTVE